MGTVVSLFRTPANTEGDPSLKARLERRLDTVEREINGDFDKVRFTKGEDVISFLESKREGLADIVLVCGHRFDGGLDDVGLVKELEQRKLLPAGIIFYSPQAPNSLIRVPAMVKAVTDKDVQRLSPLVKAAFSGANRGVRKHDIKAVEPDVI